MSWDDFNAAAEALAGASRVVALTGAGISAGSGLGTYHGPGGMWSDAELLKAHSLAALPHSLPVIWATKGALKNAALDAQPNAAHLALAALEGRLENDGGTMLVATQNIDGLHTRAGSRHVSELHGTVMRSRCSKRGCSMPTWDDTGRYDPAAPIPTCPRCGRTARPAIVLFGEQLPSKVLRRAAYAARTCQVLLVVGTSGVVYPAAGLIEAAAGSGARVILINAQRWEHPHPDIAHTLIGPAEDLLPALVAEAR